MSQNLEGVLFSEDGREVTQQDLIFSKDIPPLFAGNKVLDPKPLIVEGTYYLYDGKGGYVKRVLTKADLEQYFKNATRDVAVNYEHNREDLPKGWVRLRDTKRLDYLETPEGPKLAIFAAIELMPEAADLVAKGVYRDVSIELKPISKEITGLALTAYPVVRHLQFSEEADNSQALTELAETPMDKETVLREALEEYGLSLEELKALPQLLAQAKEMERRAKEAERQARFAQLRTELEAKTLHGGLKLAPGSLDALAALYLYAEEHAELQFSLDAKAFSLKELLDEVLAGMEALKVFGETGAGALEAKSAPSDTDPNRVKAIVELATRRMVRFSE